MTGSRVDDAFIADRGRQETGAVTSPRSSSVFAGFRFPREVISVAVRWYLRYGLSYRDVEELLAERGVTVDHVTVYRWVQRFTPEFTLHAYERHDNLHRTHRALAAAAPLRELPHPLEADQIERLPVHRHDRVGGVIHEYQHTA